MTWAELDIVCKGYEIRLARSRELPRYIASILINTNRNPKKSAIVTPQDIMPLITDRKKEVKLMTLEHFEQIKKEREKIVWQKTN
jgi:hypothetical protein